MLQLKDLSIIIIDDEELIVKLFSRTLEAFSRISHVYTSRSLQEAVPILTERIINVAVLDLNLKETKGLETLVAFEALFPEVPVVVVTGGEPNGLSYKCFSAGASEFLTKPVDPMLLYKSCIYTAEKYVIRTQMRVAKEELAISELRYRRLFESAQDGILILDFDTGQILDVNPYLKDMLGYSHDEYLGKKLWEIGPFRDIARSKTLFLELQEKGYVRYEEMPLQTKGGKKISVEFVSNSYPVNGNTFIQCNIRDTTERTILEGRQQLVIKILRILNSAVEQKVVIGNILEAIHKYTNILIESVGIRLKEGDDYPYFIYRGFDRSFIAAENSLCSKTAAGDQLMDSCGLPVLDCVCGCVIRGRTGGSPFFTARGSFWTNGPTKLLADSPPVLQDLKIRNRCHSEGYESVAVIPLSTGDEIIGLIQLNDRKPGLFTESFILFMEELATTIAVAVRSAAQEDRIRIMEVAKTRDLLQSSRLLNAGIAHELRTPLQSLLNCLELIKEEATGWNSECTVREFIIDLSSDGIDRTSYAVRVLNSLSEYSKIASTEEIHLINVVQELKTIMKALSFTDQFKGMSEDNFFLECEHHDDCFTQINRVDFSQLIINLCRNAREAINHDQPRISISVRKRDLFVEIRVIDNGRGIDSTLGNRVFEPYFSTKDNPDVYNQGLGLAMVRDTIATYSGSIHYESCPGHTEFILNLPCVQGE